MQFAEYAIPHRELRPPDLAGQLGVEYGPEDFRDRVVLITGATGDIGNAIVDEFAGIATLCFKLFFFR